ncbi:MULTISPECIES: CatB-related O-acetyltransferase [unclassified Mesorhizobium]|uniref:CatB-related O-acetyltransferase n=1 Tax=unclassified Mesorhizobium TaxID=325217 RepID=UPI0003CF5B0A|nr:acetyltransferase [Mesorhizobium sp. LNJC374B00]ESY61175.1 acetyltransferase [Mesorhizobium sp. LNJC372A00]
MSKATDWLRKLGLLKARQTWPRHVTVGSQSHSNLRPTSFLHCTEQSPVEIGAFCSIAPEVLFVCQANHPTETASTFGIQDRIGKTKSLYEYLRTKGPIIVGNDVWIGTRAIILAGVTIGDGAVIAAGGVVTKDVPPYAIVGGNPAKLIRYRFSDETIEAMRNIRWWDWPVGVIKRQKAAFELPAEEFVKRFEGVIVDEMHGDQP